MTGWFRQVALKTDPGLLEATIGVLRLDRKPVPFHELDPPEERSDGALIVHTRFALPGTLEYEGGDRIELIPPVELSKRESLDTMKRKVVTDRHPEEEPLDDGNVMQFQVGDVGDDVWYNEDAGPHGAAECYAAIRDGQLKDAAKAGDKVFVSPGYLSDLKTKDEFPKKQIEKWIEMFGPFHYVQTNRRYNHLMVTSKPRAGTKVFFRADSLEEENVDLKNRYRTDAVSHDEYRADAFESLSELFKMRAAMLETPDKSFDEVVQALAENLSFSVEDLRAIMQGQTKPSPDQAKEIASALDIPKAKVDQFLDSGSSGPGEQRGDEDGELQAQLNQITESLQFLQSQLRGDATDEDEEREDQEEPLDLPDDLQGTFSDAQEAVESIREKIEELQERLEQKEKEKNQIEQAMQKLKGKFQAMTSSSSSSPSSEGAGASDGGAGDDELRGDDDTEDSETSEESDDEYRGDSRQNFEEYMEEKARLVKLADRYNIDSATDKKVSELKHEIAKAEVGEEKYNEAIGEVSGEDDYRKDSDFVEGVLEGLQMRNDALEDDAQELSEIFGSVEGTAGDDERKEEKARKKFKERRKSRSKIGAESPNKVTSD